MMIKLKIPVNYPPGNWRPIGRSISFDIVGVQHCKTDGEAFIRNADKCIRRDRAWRILCEREPENSYDKNAVAVFGWWTAKGWFSERLEKRKVGYWPRELAAAIAKTIPLHIPLAARPTSLYLSDQGFIDIEIVGLVDRSWQGKVDW